MLGEEQLAGLGWGVLVLSEGPPEFSGSPWLSHYCAMPTGSPLPLNWTCLRALPEDDWFIVAL